MSSIPPSLSFRDHSVNAVLSHVHRAGLVSRSELARAVGLNRSSIARVLGELTERGFIEPAGAARGGSRGRPSLLVQASPDGPVALAAQILPDAVVVAAGGLGGQLLVRERHGRAAGDALVAQVAGLLGDLAARYRRQRVVSAVIASPEAPGDPALPDDVAVCLNQLLIVRATAAADVAAVGEQRRGAGTGLSTVLYVTAQPEAAAGLVLDGQLFQGASGGAGRIAHLGVNPGGARCVCGRRGCLGVEIDVSALLRATRWSGASAEDGVDAALRDARAGERRALRAMERIGAFLGTGLAQLSSILNPDAIVLGGHLAGCLPFMAASVAESMRAVAAPPARILAGALGDDAAIVGAIEIGLQPLFAPVWTAPPALPHVVPAADRAAG